MSFENKIKKNLCGETEFLRIRIGEINLRDEEATQTQKGDKLIVWLSLKEIFRFKKRVKKKWERFEDVSWSRLVEECLTFFFFIFIEEEMKNNIIKPNNNQMKMIRVTNKIITTSRLYRGRHSLTIAFIWKLWDWWWCERGDAVRLNWIWNRKESIFN